MGWLPPEIQAAVDRKRAEEAARRQQMATTQSGDWIRNQTMQGMLDAQGRAAPQAGRTQIGQVSTYGGATINQGPQDQFRARELALADRLTGISTGAQQGAGELAVQRQGQRAAAQQIGMARMQRGAGAGMAGLTAARNVGNLGIATAGQAQQAAMGDQQMANQTLSGLLGQGRGADIGLATSQAGMQQQAGLASMDARNQRVFQQAGLDQATSLANMQARLQQTGMNDQAALGYLAQLYGLDVAEMQARLQAEQLRQGQQQIDNAESIGLGDLLQAGGTLGAAKLAASDRRLKKDIKVADATIDDLLDNLRPYTYRYKDEKHGKGERAGIMAQEMERSEMGRRIVTETADGKMIDINKAVSATLAAAARLNQRVRTLEEAAEARGGVKVADATIDEMLGRKRRKPRDEAR